MTERCSGDRKSGEENGVKYVAAAVACNKESPRREGAAFTMPSRPSQWLAIFGNPLGAPLTTYIYIFSATSKEYVHVEVGKGSRGRGLG